MGMAAGQARLLSITARLTDNENSGQALSFSKQRLADEVEQVNRAYEEALNATKIQILTGFNGAVPNYTDISYGLLTGYETVGAGQQYVVTNQKGQVLVPKEYKDAFEAGNGDINIFLSRLNVNGRQGFSQADIRVNKDSGDDDGRDEAIEKIHNAWDKYLNAVGEDYEKTIHTGVEMEVDYVSSNTDMFGGYVTINGNIINYEGASPDIREMYDYAVSLTEAFYGNSNSLGVLQTSVKDPENLNIINYLKNIFNQMATFGYYTTEDEHQAEADTIRDNGWFQEQLKQGKLLIKSFSATEGTFVATTLSDDSMVQEVRDEKKIAMVEAKYTQETAALERKDQKIDLELKKLDTEHNALQTEYESVKNVIDKDVEKSFNCFS